MAGWLGSNFTAQLDQLKKGVNQVSSIVKDTLVVDETWDQEQVQDSGDVGEQFLEEDLSSKERELYSRYQKLERLYNVAVEEKEAQCQTFRELLLEKENDIAQLSDLLDKANTEHQPQVDAKTKLSNVLQALGQNISEEESFDNLLEKVINITDGSKTGDQFIGGDSDQEKEKLLKLTQKLKSECWSLREKLKEMEQDVSSREECLSLTEELKCQSLQLEEAKLSLAEITGENEKWLQKDEHNEMLRKQQALENNELENALKLKTEEIDNLKEKNVLLQNESESKSTEIASLTKQNSQCKENQSLMESNIIQLEAVQRELSGKLELKLSEYSKLTSQCEKLNSTLMETEQENNQLKEKLATLSEQNASQESSEALEASNLKEELSRCRDQMDQLLEEKEESQNKERQAKAELAESEEKRDDLERKLRETMDKFNICTERAETEQSKLSSLLSEIAIKDKELEKYQEKTEEFMQTNCLNETIVRERDCLQKEIELLKTQNETLLGTQSQIEAKLAVTEENLLESTSCRDSLNSELVESKAQLEASNGQNKTLEEELETTRQNCDNLKTQLEASESLKQELTYKYETVTSDYENLQREFSQFEGRFQDAQANVKEVSESELQVAELQTANSQLLKDLESVKSGYEAEIIQIQTALNTAQSKLNVLAELQENYEDIKSNNSLLGEEMLQLKESYHQLQMEIANLRGENEDLEMKNIKHEDRERNLVKQKDLADATLVSTNTRIQELLEENENLQNSIKSSSESFSILKKELESREVSLQKAEESLEDMKSKEENYTEALNSLKSINESISRKARETEGEKMTLKQNESLLVSEIEKMKEKGNALQTRDVELSSQVEILTSIKKGLEEELLESNKRISCLEEDVKNLSTKKENKDVEEKDVDESEESAVDKNMIQVLNEKIRENAKLKSENSRLIKNINQQSEEKEQLVNEIEESKKTFSSMNSEALKKLSLMIRDKDLEIESLSQKNKSLLEVLENEKGEETGKDSEREVLLLEEIKKLKDENVKDKNAVDNSNELLFLKGKIQELEGRLSMPAEPELNGVQEGGQEGGQDGDHTDRSLALRLETKSVQLLSSEKQIELLNIEINEMKTLLLSKDEELCQISEERNLCKKKEGELEQEVERVRRSLLSVQGLLDEKQSSNESQQEQSLKYISECERLSQELTQMTNEKSAALMENRARSQEAQDLRREVSSIIEKKKRVEGEVERLRTHLMQVEEGYTVELMEGEEREKELRKKVAGLEDSLRVATHTSSEVTESASQVSSQLTAALETAAGQREKLSEELATAQASLRTRNMELRNLQLALEGFQKQKENELGMMEKTCEEKVVREQRIVVEVQEKLRVNKQQLDRAQQGLEAAARLSEQLDKKSSTISNLKQEMSVREEMVKNLQEKMLDMTNGQVGKVDRDLVKNLVIGYTIADVGKKPEILRVIATVLDFNGEERTKTGLDSSSGGWLGGFLGASRSRHGSSVNSPLEQNIARAFIKFLEEESAPRDPVTLPVVEMARSKSEQLAQATPRSGTTPSPLLTVETPPRMNLPSLSTSHSPSILKSVLDQTESNNSSK